MPTKTLAIIEEYLRSPHEQPRKNALTALAALGDQASVARLVELAVDETDPALRKHAEAELLRLKGEPRELAALQLEAALLLPQRRRCAYGMLGRLYEGGYNFAPPDLSFFERGRLALTLFAYLHPLRNWRFWFRALKPAALGTLFGLVVLVASGFLTGYWQTVTFGVTVLTGCGLFMVSVCATLLATRRSTSAVFYYDRRLAYLLEPGWAMLLTAPAIGLYLWVYWYYNKEWISPKLGFPICLTIFLVGVIRLGVMLGHGCHARRWLNQLSQISTGVAAAILAVIAMYFLRWMTNADGTAEGHTPTYFITWLAPPGGALSHGWRHLVPLSFALACAWAAIDRLESTLKRAAPRPRRLLVFTLIALNLGAVCWSGYVIRSRTGEAVLARGYSLLGASPDGQYVAFYNYQDPQPQILLLRRDSLQPLAPPILNAWQAVFSPNHQWLALIQNNEVSIRELPSLKEIKRLAQSAGLSNVQFAPNGALLAAQTGEAIHLWETANWAEVTSDKHSLKAAGSLEFFSPDSNKLATSRAVLDLTTWETIPLKNNNEEWQVLAFFPDSQRLLLKVQTEWWGDITRAAIFDLATRRIVGGVRFNQTAVATLRLSQDGQWLALATSTALLLGETRTLLQSAEPDNWPYWHTPEYDGSIRRILKREEIGGPQPLAFRTTYLAQALAFSPDNHWLVFGEGAAIRTLDLTHLRLVALLKSQHLGFTDLTILPDGALLANDLDNHYTLWAARRWQGRWPGR